MATVSGLLHVVKSPLKRPFFREFGRFVPVVPGNWIENRTV